MKHFLLPRASWVLVLTLLGGCASIQQGAGQSATIDVPPRVIFVVRHAERFRTEHGDRDPLTDEGVERAQALARVLHDAGVTKIFATQTLRTRETACPLELALRAEGRSVSIDDSLDHDADGPAILRYVAHHSSATDVVLIVQHHEHIPEILSALRPAGGPIPTEPELRPVYDELWVLTRDSGKHWRMVELHYGGPSKPGGKHTLPSPCDQATTRP